MTQRRDENGLPLADDPYEGAAARDMLGSIGAGLFYGLIITSTVLYFTGLICRWWSWEGGIVPALLIGIGGTTLLAVGGAILRAMR